MLRQRLIRFVLCVLSLCVVASVAAQEYMIGAGDVLKITVWGHDDLSKDYPVTRDGDVAFPLVGQVRAQGLSTTEFGKRLRDLLEKDYLVNPQVLVAVKEYLSKKVQILGEAERPGLYYLTGPTNLVEVLSKAGGLSKNAGKELVLVRPDGRGAGGSSILRFDLRKVQAGDVKENIPVQGDDTIFVPKAQAFFVLGEVRSPGTYPLDKETNALEAVTLAQGFTDKAAPSGVKLLRRTAAGKQETIALNLSGAVPVDKAVAIQDGDTVLVPKGNTFFVFGEVKKPGAYQIDKDTNILEGITIAGGLTDKAAAGRTRIIRTTSKGQEILYVDVNEILKRGQSDKAIRIRENDVIVVPESFF